MKKHLILIGNIFIIIIGIFGLGVAGELLDPAFLQPSYIVFLVIAVYGQIIKIKETLSFMPLILELVFGITGFFYIFPFQNQTAGFICLGGILFVSIWPPLRKFLRRKKIVTIKV